MASLAIGAGIGAVGSMIGAGKQASATRDAAKMQQETAANSLAFQQGAYNTTLANEQPYLGVGSQAAGALSSGLSDGSLLNFPGGAFHFSPADFQNDPAYAFNQQQGQQAIQRSAAAQGGLVSGGALKDLANYSQGLAGNQYQQSYSNALAAYQQAYGQFENKYSQLSGLAGIGQNAATQTATSGANAAGQIGATNANTANALAGLTMSGANAQVGALAAGANSLQSGLNQYSNNLAMQRMMQGSSYAPPSASQWAAYDAGSTPAGVRDWV